jgi:hypothetical protein
VALAAASRSRSRLKAPRPGLIRAQTVSTPVRIGLLSDVGGTYQDNGGPGK